MTTRRSECDEQGRATMKIDLFQASGSSPQMSVDDLTCPIPPQNPSGFEQFFTLPNMLRHHFEPLEISAFDKLYPFVANENHLPLSLIGSNLRTRTQRDMSLSAPSKAITIK
jgi:hypothetical protein